MADVKISQLPVATTPVDGTEVLPIVQSATTKQVSIANLTAGRAMSASSLTLTTPLAVTSGGTGIATAAQGSLLSATGADTFSATRTPTLGLAGTAAGTLGLSGSTSGVVTLATAATTNNWTFTLPTNAGTNNFILTTNGSGVTSWTNPTALGVDLDVGGTAITGGTSGRILYDNAGLLGELVTGTGVATAIGNNTNSASGLAVLNSSGYLNVAQGGTGLGSLTANYIPYGNGTSAFSSTPNLQYNGIVLNVGASPSAWSGMGAIQIFGGGVFGTSSSYARFGSNFYYDGANYKYTTSAEAARYEQAAGAHVWYTASSGTANNTITFSQAMNLSTNGSLSLSAVGSTAGQSTTYYVSGPAGLNSGYTSFGMQTNGSDTTKPRASLFCFGSTYSGSYQALVANSTVLSAAYCDLSFNTETNHSINFYPFGTYAGRFDTSGNFLVGTATTGGKVTIKATPTSQWGMDFSQCTVSVANGGNALLPVGAGMIIITDPTTSGATGVYIFGAANSTRVASTSGTFVNATTTPGAGTASICFDGSSGYRIYNNIGSTIGFQLAMFRTRDAV